MKNYVILGSGPVSKYVISILFEKKINKQNIFLIDLFDKNHIKKKILGIPIYKHIDKFDFHEIHNSVFLIANSKNEMRKFLINKLKDKKLSSTTLISKYSYVCQSAIIGEGSIICPNVYIGPNTIIGDNALIHANCNIDHDCVIANNVNLSPGVNLAGSVKIGDNVTIYTGSNIAPKITINNNIVIGIGSTILNDLLRAGIYYGTPAKIIKNL